MQSVQPQSTAKRTQISSRKPFTQEEDAKLVELVSSQLYPNWNAIASMLHGRTARQCRERWTEYLNPAIKFEPWTNDEDTLLVDMVQKFGHKWTYISRMFNGRTDNDVKNRWYTHLKNAVVVDGNGKMTLMRDDNGEIISSKKKRKRKIVCANQNAFLTLEQNRQKQVLPYPSVIPTAYAVYYPIIEIYPPKQE